jgi:DNA-directed RNA polymerase specialized sigma24 family protein
MILGRLPDHLGAVVVAVDVERVPVKEYADAMGAVVSTVSGMVCQARHAVARELRRESAVEAHQMARRRRRSLAGRGLRRS